MYTSQDCAVVVVTRHANARLGDAREQADATIALYAPRRQRKPLDETGLSRDRGLRPETQTHGLLLLCLLFLFLFYCEFVFTVFAQRPLDGFSFLCVAIKV